MGDSEFEYSSDEDGRDGKATERQAVENKPHDEEVALGSDTESSVDDAGGSDAAAPPSSHVPTRTSARRAPRPERTQRGVSSVSTTFSTAVAGETAAWKVDRTEESFASSSFSGLDVSPEIRNLFGLIDEYTPTRVNHATPLKPFVPEYVPAIGDIDEFIKVPRPDGKEDELGLRALDEVSPSAQSDPVALSLRLRRETKRRLLSGGGGGAATGGRDLASLLDDEVTSVQYPEREPETLRNWIETVAGLRGGRLESGGVGRRRGFENETSAVLYSRNMPDIESLMRAWDGDEEEVLTKLKPTEAGIPVPLRERAEIVCAALDVPVYENIVESMHVVFSTYLEFKRNPILKGGNAG